MKPSVLISKLKFSEVPIFLGVVFPCIRFFNTGNTFVQEYMQQSDIAAQPLIARHYSPNFLDCGFRPDTDKPCTSGTATIFNFTLNRLYAAEKLSLIL